MTMNLVVLSILILISNTYFSLTTACTFCSKKLHLGDLLVLFALNKLPNVVLAFFSVNLQFPFQPVCQPFLNHYGICCYALLFPTQYNSVLI